jgi:hypothetical protein
MCEPAQRADPSSAGVCLPNGERYGMPLMPVSRPIPRRPLPTRTRRESSPATRAGLIAYGFTGSGYVWRLSNWNAGAAAGN